MRVKFIHKIPDLSILFFTKTAKIYFGRFGIFGYILVIRKDDILITKLYQILINKVGLAEYVAMSLSLLWMKS